jgi:hypothetical protein
MKTTRSASVPWVFASRTSVNASSQFVQPLGLYWFSRYGPKTLAIVPGVTVV